MVALRSAVHGRAWAWRLELETDGGETTLARLRLASELGGTAKEHSAAALLLGGQSPRLVLGGAAGVRWWTRRQQHGGASAEEADRDRDRGCFAELREHVPLRQRVDDDLEGKGGGEGEGEAADHYYDDSDDEDDVRAHRCHPHSPSLCRSPETSGFVCYPSLSLSVSASPLH
jgi:hypothetical protein